jgi:hypothetical protein
MLNDDQSEKTCRAIGLFIFSFSQLEYTLRHYLSEEVHLESQFFNAVISHDFALLCTAFMNVFLRTRGQNFVDELSPLIKQCRELNDERVRVVHGLWMPAFEGGIVYHVGRGNLSQKEYKGYERRLTTAAEKASAVERAIENLIFRLPEVIHHKP